MVPSEEAGFTKQSSPLQAINIFRKEGGRCGFAESIPQERITALKKDQTSVEMTDVSETVSSIVQTAEALPQSVPSPLVPVPGVGQVGEVMRNTWGLEEEEDGDRSGEDSVEEVAKMEEEQHKEDKSKKVDVVEILDSDEEEEEEVVILYPESTKKAKNKGSTSGQKGAAASRKKQKK